MSVTIVGTSASATVRSREKYRATWGVTPGGVTLEAVTLGALRQNLAAEIRAIFEERLTRTGVAYPVSQPAVAPGDLAATLDLRTVATLPSGTTVAALARMLEAVSFGGRFILLRLERVPEGQSQAAATTARDAVTAAANTEVEKSSPVPDTDFFGDLFKKLGETYRTAVYLMAGGVVVYLLWSSGALKKALK